MPSGRLLILPAAPNCGWMVMIRALCGLTLLEQLSGKSSYYGFLAADRLKREYLIEQENAEKKLSDA